MNWRNIQVVQIGDKYAVRRGWIFHDYLDLGHSSHWWSKYSSCFPWCLSRDLLLVTKRHDLWFDRPIMNFKEVE